MESEVQSGAKCSSDFSIDRILSDDSRSSRDGNEAPSWLCCTRYRPPRLPRSGGSASRARRSGRHARVPFTGAQAAALEAAYVRSPYLAPPALRALAAALQLRDDRIKIWFQNRRARERREKSINLTPPRDVTLPATPRLLPIVLPHYPSAINEPNTNSPYRRSTTTLDNTEESNADSRAVMYTQCFSENVNRPDTPLDIETIED